MSLEQQPKVVEEVLKRFSLEEREHWLSEINRLSLIIENYDNLRPKRQLNKRNGKYEFSPKVLGLCRDAACINPVIIAREPHRAHPPSPETLDKWSRKFKKIGIIVFLRNPLPPLDRQCDRRLAYFSAAAIHWINRNYKKYNGCRALFVDLKKEAEKNDWIIPSESWLYQRWRKIPQIVQVYVFEGSKAYESKIAPYVPRSYDDLDALQVLSGDHFERDVTVDLGDGILGRPWLTLWLCLRTYLIWGWYLSCTPTAATIALAYEDGLTKYGAQPFSRPDENYYSYLQTDRGKTYCSHDITGKVIKVHQEAFSITSGLQTILTERKVGLIKELNLEHLLTRGGNAKEKAVERIGKDLSHWEAKTFAEYCGKNASSRPEAWYGLYKQHQKYLKGEGSKPAFISFEQYKLALKDRIDEFNNSTHERATLGGKKIVPIDEFNSLYTTKYVIPEQTVALLLLKSASRTIVKNGVNCFRNGWYYDHPEMDLHRGRKVEIRYTDNDYLHVWVVLPSGRMCKAELITPTSLINPNKQTLEIIKESRRRQKQTIKDNQLILESEVRGESVEENTAIEQRGKKTRLNEMRNHELTKSSSTTNIYQFPTIRRSKISVAESHKKVSAEDVKKAANDDFKTDTKIKSRIREFDSEE